MDAAGNVVAASGRTGVKNRPVLPAATAGNRIQTYPFTVPACGGSLLSAAGIPAGSADGSAWIESTSNCTFIGNAATAYIGALVRFTP